MKQTVLLAAFIAAMAVPAMAGEPQTVADYLKLAEQKEGDLDYGGAIEIYDAILKQFPKEFPDVYVSRAEDLALVGYEKEAIKDYDKALALDSADPKGPYLKHDVILEDRGKAKADIGNYKGAVADFTKALASRPKDPFLFYHRADARLSAGDCAGAISDYSSTMEFIDTPSSLYYEGRAIARICTGDLQAALEDYRTDIALENKSDSESNAHNMHDSFLNAWTLMVRLGRKADADAQLSAELAAAGAPDGVGATHNAARYFLGQADEAVLFSDAEALKAKQPDAAGSFESDAYYYAGLKQLADGNKAKALEDFRKVLAIRQHTVTIPELTHAWIKELGRKRS